jgi:uncharacterized protein
MELVRCAKIGDFQEVKRLLEQKVDANTPGNRGALHFAASKGGIELMQLLIEHQANIEQSDSIGWTPLHMATFSNSNAAKLLLQHGADAMHRTKGGSRFTPLHQAARNRNERPIIALIHYRADINALDV